MRPAAATLAAICVQIMQYQATFISLRDMDFEKEDAVLNASLFQRMAINNPALQPRLVQVREVPRPALRRNAFKELDPTDLQVRQHMIQSMKQLIYSTQYRIRDLEALTQKYSDDIRYRIAFIFCRLRSLEEEMEEQYSALWAKIKKRYNIAMRFLTTLFYYEHDLRRFVDIVYIVEHFFKLHEEYMTSLEDGDFKNITQAASVDHLLKDHMKKVNTTAFPKLPDGVESLPDGFFDKWKDY